ncbi:MAG: hypothetical protein MK184_02275 [Acidimicrobiales bacterium]|nr:hypothetical protein [Acidimicrobiales bacterium]
MPDTHTTRLLVMLALISVASCSAEVATSVEVAATTVAVLPTTTAAPATTATAAPATTATAASTTTTVGQTVPRRTPSAEDPLRVMIVGDSVTYEIQPGLTAALEHTGLVTSANRTQVGFGLSRWPIYPWWDVWEPFLDEVQPEAVVIQAGIWDVAEVFASELRRPVPTDPDWDEQFTFLMEVAVDVLSSDGAIVYWQTMLPSTSPGPGGRLNDLVADLADRDDRVVMVDLTPAFTRNGGYTGFVERDGVEWPIRKVDGVHLCREGSEIAGRVTAEAIATDWGFEVVDGWEDGAWRADPLFDVDPCDDPAPPGSPS